MQVTVGEILEGKITGITKFGVFVDLGEGKSGMVHISEVAQTFVSEIRDFVKENDVVKIKVLSITEEGKISLSMKRAVEQQQPPPRPHFNRGGAPNNKPDHNASWSPKKEKDSFEEMLNRFKVTSDEKFSDLKRKNFETRRPKRGGATR